MTIWSKVMDFYWITQLGDADFCPPAPSSTGARTAAAQLRI